MIKELIENGRNHRYFKKVPALKQFLKFGIIGVVNTLIDFIIYFLLTRSMPFWREHYLWANLISFSVAVANSFYWNRRWTFRNTNKNLRVQFTKFYIINLTGLVINESLLYYLVSRVGFHDLSAKFIVVMIVVFWSFSLSKFWAFREEKSQLAK